MRETGPPPITAQAILPNEAKKREGHLSGCVLPDPAVIAATTRSGGIKKKGVTQQAKDKRTILKRNERINDEHDKYVQQQGREGAEDENNRDELNEMETMPGMDQSEEFQGFDDDPVNHEMVEYPEGEPVVVPERQAPKGKGQSNPKVKIVKGQVKELVAPKELKVPDPIRAMRNRSRFDIQKMMDLMVTLPMGQLLNESQQLRKEFAWNLQLSTPRYRVKKPNATAPIPIEEAMSNAIMRAPKVTAKALEDDGEIAPVFITTWIGNVQVNWSLVDNGSVIEVISKRLAMKIPKLEVQHDGNLPVTLATDHRTTLRDYVYVPINCQGVEAYMKAYVCPVTVYDLLLGLRWQKRVQMKIDMGKGTLSITGTDGRERMIQSKLAPIDVLKQVPIVEIEEGFDEEEALQAIIDEGTGDDLKEGR